MDLVILPQHWSALLAIGIIIGSLVFAFVKKWMITYVLIIANFIVFVLTVIFSAEILFGLPYAEFAGLGFRPLYLSIEYAPQLYTLVTSIFIHSVANPFHIIGNMFIFFFVGTAFEQRVGMKKFLIIYIVTGMCGAVTHALINLQSSTVLIGASGAIFGIMGAFAYAYPRDEVVMPIPVGIMMIIRRVKVIYAVLLFAAIETIIIWLSVKDNTAHFAHIGGLVSGVILAAALIKKGGSEHTRPSDTIYYDSYQMQKPRKIDFSTLKKLARTTEHKDMLSRIEHETVPQVRDIWLEHFLEKIPCPQCGKTLNHFNKKIWCEHCGYKTSY